MYVFVCVCACACCNVIWYGCRPHLERGINSTISPDHSGFARRCHLKTALESLCVMPRLDEFKVRDNSVRIRYREMQIKFL